MTTYSVTKVIHAPLNYVYDWATDYTEGDNAIWGGKYPKIILLKTKTKVIYAYYSERVDNKPKLAVRIVTLHPRTHSWHLDYYGEEALETGEYKLTSLGKGKTRFRMVIRSKWKKGKGSSASYLQKNSNFVWTKYAEALERDYKSGKRAK